MDSATTQRRNVEKRLKKRAFCGHYMERRLVDEYQGYRDVIWLSPEETELAADLAFASETCGSLSPNVFASYSASPVPSLWVTLKDIPLGCHWFQITSVTFTDRELTFNLKSLRSFPDVKYEKPKQVSVEDIQISLEGMMHSWKQNLILCVKSINVDSLFGIFKFLVILITTLFTGLFSLIFFLGDFSIKLVREASIFVNASTPVMLGCMEFVSKVIGGFYILLAMLWRGTTSRPPQPPPQFAPAIGFKPHQRSYPHPDRYYE